MVKIHRDVMKVAVLRVIREFGAEATILGLADALRVLGPEWSANQDPASDVEAVTGFIGNGDEKTTGYEERLARLGYTLTVKPTEPVSGLTEFISAEEAEAEAEEEAGDAEKALWLRKGRALAEMLARGQEKGES